MENPTDSGSAAAQHRARSRISRVRKPTARSRVSNGRDLLPGIDGRSLLARRYRDISASLASDQGGADHLSEARLQLVRRFAACCAIAESLEARLVSGEPIKVEEHATLCSTLVRLAGKLGIDRRSRNVGVTLRDYIDAAGRESDDPDIEEAGG